MRAIERQSVWPSVRKRALNPSTMFVVISVSFIPTEKDSSREVETAPSKTKTMNACSVPIPPGEIGTSVARLCVTCTSRTFRIVCGIPNASRKNQIATKRRNQSPACQAATWQLYLRRIAVWQACDWILRFVAIWFFLDAFGIQQTLRNVLLVQVTQSLATLVPVSPGGIGTEQAFIVFVFEGAVSTSRLLSFSVGMKLTLITTNVILGAAALFVTFGHLDWRSLAGKRSAAEAEP